MQRIVTSQVSMNHCDQRQFLFTFSQTEAHTEPNSTVNEKPFDWLPEAPFVGELQGEIVRSEMLREKTRKNTPIISACLSVCKQNAVSSLGAILYGPLMINTHSGTSKAAYVTGRFSTGQCRCVSGHKSKFVKDAHETVRKNTNQFTQP